MLNWISPKSFITDKENKRHSSSIQDPKHCDSDHYHPGSSALVWLTKHSDLTTLWWNTVFENFPAKPAVVVIRLLVHCKACNEYYNLTYSYIKNGVKLYEKWIDEVGNLVLSKLCSLRSLNITLKSNIWEGKTWGGV